MKPFRLLLVDDERDFAEPLAGRLALRGVEAECVFSGTEAAGRLDRDPPVDVVILDMSMPYPGGIETLNTLKKKNPLVEVVMLTGQSTVQNAVDALKLGAFDYLTKPCGVDDLLDVSEKAYARKKKREDALFNVRIKPYITDDERAKLISAIMDEKS